VLFQSPSQVTVEYKRDPACQGALIPKRVHTILISTQHDPDVTNEKIRQVCAAKLAVENRRKHCLYVKSGTRLF